MSRLTYAVEEEGGFFEELKPEVFKILPKEFRKKAAKKIAFKAIVLQGLFMGIMLTMYLVPVKGGIHVFLMALLGVLALPMILNIGHEAVHRNFSTNRKVNRLAKNVFFLWGTSAYFWELRHNSSHHAFANVKDVDLDIEQTNIIRLSQHQEYLGRHKFQHLYMPFAFCLYTFLWFFIRDFKDLSKKRFGAKTIKRHPRNEVIKLFGAKIWHLLAFLIIPFMVTQQIGTVLIGFFVFHIVASIVTTFALISTHVGEVQEIVLPDEYGRLPHSWATHQLVTTADFSSTSRFTLHFFAGFNHHVAHHLFPQVPHIYYPEITPLIKKYAQAHGLNYTHYPNLFTCTRSHFKRLKYLATEL